MADAIEVADLKLRLLRRERDLLRLQLMTLIDMVNEMMFAFRQDHPGDRAVEAVIGHWKESRDNILKSIRALGHFDL